MKKKTARAYKSSDCRKYTNGDRIVDGGITALTAFLTQKPCQTCVYWKNDHCQRPKDKKCADGIEMWLNLKEVYDEQ